VGNVFATTIATPFKRRGSGSDNRLHGPRQSRQGDMRRQKNVKAGNDVGYCAYRQTALPLRTNNSIILVSAMSRN
jgi:hypothetical protein